MARHVDAAGKWRVLLARRVDDAWKMARVFGAPRGRRVDLARVFGAPRGRRVEMTPECQSITTDIHCHFVNSDAPMGWKCALDKARIYIYYLFRFVNYTHITLPLPDLPTCKKKRPQFKKQSVFIAFNLHV